MKRERSEFRVDDTQIDAACEAMARAKRISVHGCGREALQIKGFAMRLFHLGMPVSVVGDMTMPPLGKATCFSSLPVLASFRLLPR